MLQYALVFSLATIAITIPAASTATNSYHNNIAAPGHTTTTTIKASHLYFF